MTDFSRKTVLITGAAQGLGRLLALQAAAKGASLVLLDINSEKLEATKKELLELSPQVLTYVCDLSQKDQIQPTAKQIQNDVGGIDILINNAGVVSGKSLLECSDEQIERSFQVNSLALFWLTRALLPEMMKKNSGHIVTVSSAAGVVAVPLLADYCASKFAAFAFDEALRLEIKKQQLNIRTTVICPYFIDTGMFKGVKTKSPILLPFLNEKKVANSIIKAIEKNKKRLILPKTVYLIWIFRLFPVGFFDWVTTWLGLDRVMETYEGKK